MDDEVSSSGVIDFHFSNPGRFVSFPGLQAERVAPSDQAGSYLVGGPVPDLHPPDLAPRSTGESPSGFPKGPQTKPLEPNTIVALPVCVCVCVCVCASYVFSVIIQNTHAHLLSPPHPSSHVFELQIVCLTWRDTATLSPGGGLLRALELCSRFRVLVWAA